MQRHRAGGSIDDRCRPCKVLRRHTVLVVDGEGTPLRVICDTCGSQHNYRGGEKPEPSRTRPAHPAPSREPLAIVTERESSGEPIQYEGVEMTDDLERLLRRIIREEAGLSPVVPADKWRGGEMVLRPGREGLQEKSWPIETFFHKVVMVRNRLRVLEQQINGAEVPQELKVKLQGYITSCYGSLTSFNVLFADEDDRFSGSGSG